MTEVIEFVKNQPTTKDEVVKALTAYKSADLSTQAKTGEKLIAQVKVYEEAVQIMGDNIYELNVENDTLRNIIGNVDEKKVAELCQQKKQNDSRVDKNKIILASLQKTMSKNKAVCSAVIQK